MDKNPLYKVGDKINFMVNVPMIEGMPYKHNVWYPGIITRHVVDSYTFANIVIDDGSTIEVKTFYNDFQSGYESIQLLVSQEELEERRLIWLNALIDEETIAYHKRIEFLKSIKFYQT